ncbi:MAG: FtsH protease activity modulator HflK [Alphaproteobacteria bacterium]|nr:FtsH protease activity modulator HflK [Alphaproteobacteria bacterium]
MAGNKSPWDNSNDDNQNPWQPQRGGEDPQNMEDLLRKSQDKVRYIMNGGKNRGGFGRKSFWGIAAVIGLLWILSGFYQVQPQEQGVVLRFGRYAYTTAPGLHYHLPYPIETVLTPNVSRENRIEIGFRSEPIRRGRGMPVRDIQAENIALTGDENIVEVNFTVTWKVKNAGDYLFNIRDPEATVRTAAESAMRDSIGVTPIMEIIADDRKGVQERAEKTLQALLDKYKAGITVTSVQLTKADAPTQVIDAFNDVQRAKADKERLSNEAEAYRNDILPRARGEASQIISEAEAYKSRVIDAAKGDTARFVSVLEEYLKDKEVVARRMYLETMEDVYGHVDKVIVDKKVGGVVPYLPLPEVNKKK